jgi:hypothetical protein
MKSSISSPLISPSGSTTTLPTVLMLLASSLML